MPVQLEAATERARARIGTVLKGKWRLEKLIGVGGMAAVYAATHRNKKRVAIKMLHPELSVDEAIRERFLREGYVANSVGHRGAVSVDDDVVSEDGLAYLVMELLDGETIEQRWERKGRLLSPHEALSVMDQLLDTLAAAHARGIVHRDLKPENIMVDDQDRIKLIDFGIAGQAGARRLTFAKLTQVMGTPDYISPEQVKGKRGDGRSDIYALGVMLYEMLTGTTPFHGPNPFATMNERFLNNPVPPREIDPKISPQLQEIIYRAMERDPKNRYATAREFAKDLEHPEQALYPDITGPLDSTAKQVIYNSYRRGMDVDTLAKNFQRNRSSMYRVLSEIRAQRLLEHPIEYIYHESFDDRSVAVVDDRDHRAGVQHVLAQVIRSRQLGHRHRHRAGVDHGEDRRGGLERVAHQDQHALAAPEPHRAKRRRQLGHRGRELGERPRTLALAQRAAGACTLGKRAIEQPRCEVPRLRHARGL